MNKYIWIAALLFFAYITYYFFFKTMLVLGQPAPKFEARDINGQKIRLEQFEGKYVLIDFWGSWCGPCRKENPILVMMYNRYNSMSFKDAQGIEFLSIALDAHEDKAIEAINVDGLKWPFHIVEKDMMNGQIAKAYQVSSIPRKYLIGPDQNIVLTNPSIQELDDFLAYKVLKN